MEKYTVIHVSCQEPSTSTKSLMRIAEIFIDEVPAEKRTFREEMHDLDFQDLDLKCIKVSGTSRKISKLSGLWFHNV